METQSTLTRRTARVRCSYGLACEVEHEDRSLRVDLPRDQGGGATGPHPAQLMRASLGSCLLMGYKLWAERLGIALQNVELELSCDFDERGQLGLDDTVAVGWSRVVIDATFHSTASDAEITRLVEVAHRHNPMLANLAEHIAREIHVRRA
ncbi:MAG TPA: OsmC family protein [Polyangiales bacterium]|nr:OsmC family protein [Polyangiales bacterium]